MALFHFAFLVALALGSAWGDRFQSVDHESVPGTLDVIEEDEAIGDEAASEEQRAATDEELGTAEAASLEQGAAAEEELYNPEAASFEQRAAVEEELGSAEEQGGAAEELGTAEGIVLRIGTRAMTRTGANAALKALVAKSVAGGGAVANRISGGVRNYGAGRGGVAQGVGAVRGYGYQEEEGGRQTPGVIRVLSHPKHWTQVEKFSRLFMQMKTMDMFLDTTETRVKAVESLGIMGKLANWAEDSAEMVALRKVAAGRWGEGNRLTNLDASLVGGERGVFHNGTKWKSTPESRKSDQDEEDARVSEAAKEAVKAIDDNRAMIALEARFFPDE